MFLTTNRTPAELTRSTNPFQVTIEFAHNLLFSSDFQKILPILDLFSLLSEFSGIVNIGTRQYTLPGSPHSETFVHALLFNSPAQNSENQIQHEKRPEHDQRYEIHPVIQTTVRVVHLYEGTKRINSVTWRAETRQSELRAVPNTRLSSILPS